MKNNTIETYRAAEFRALKQRLFAYDIERAVLDETSAPMSGWLLALADIEPEAAPRLICEYKKFLLLAATVSAELTPPRLVDEVWHVHLGTSDYSGQFCPSVFGCTIKHVQHEFSAASRERCRENYLRTLEAYRQTFGDPPADIWGADAASLPYAHCAAVRS